MFKKLPVWLTAPILFLAVVLIICVGGWLVWFNTRPVYDKEKWDKMTSSPPEFILYLFDPTPSNAVRALRDGLMSELARSGKLPSGYPRLIEVSWENVTPRCHDKDILSNGRYFIQLSEVQNNYIEVPLCPLTPIDSHLVIHILPAWPWAHVGHDTAEIFIGMSRSGDPEKKHLLKPGQEDVIMKSLENMGVKLYLDEYFHYDTKYGK